MTAVNYLQRHPTSGIYSFRRAVPPELRAALGKREVVRSLRTKDPVEAKRLAMIKAIEVEKLFAEAQRAAKPDQPLPASVLSLAEAEQWAQAWKAAELAQDAEERARRPAKSADWAAREAETLARNEANFCELLARNDSGLIARRVALLAGEHGLDLSRHPEAFRVLGNAVLRAFAELYGELRGRAEGKWTTPLAPAPVAAPPPPAAEEPDAISLAQAFKLFAAERRLRPQTELEFSASIRRFGEVAGGDLPVSKVTKDRPNRVKINEELAPFALALALADQLRDVEEIHPGRGERVTDVDPRDNPCRQSGRGALGRALVGANCKPPRPRNPSATDANPEGGALQTMPRSRTQAPFNCASDIHGRTLLNDLKSIHEGSPWVRLPFDREATSFQFFSICCVSPRAAASTAKLLHWKRSRVNLLA